MPGCVRKDDKATRIALDILGPNPSGFVDKYGKKRKYRRKKENRNVGGEGEHLNRFEEIGYR